MTRALLPPQAVIQLARAQGVRTVNVVRPRDDWDATVAHLTALGADVVTTEEKLKNDLKAAGLPAPALALDCVGGSASTAVAKCLRRAFAQAVHPTMVVC